MNVSVIGLGKLGACIAAHQAQTHNVVGVDLDKRTVDLLNDARSPIIEPGLPKLLKRVKQNLVATNDIGAVEGTDVSLVIVPTPSLKDGRFTSRFVMKAVAGIGDAVKDQPNRHVVVICSTVMPGECDGPITMTLEEHSGKTVGEDIGLVYSPEFIALGSVLHDLENPAVTLIGESDSTSGSTYAELVPLESPIFYMSLVSAEIAKIALNAYVTMKISFANVLGEICENTLDANAHEITEAIGYDPRVGSAYISPGGPYGGPCFPRDNRAFSIVGKDAGIPMPLTAATDEINSRQVERTIAHIRKHDRKRVGIVGFSYKAGTPVFEESFGLNLAKQLIFEGYEVAVHDPMMRIKPADVPEEISWFMSPEPCFGNKTVTIIANPDKDILKIFPEVFSNDGRVGSVVIDVWDFLPPSPWDDTHIIRLGRGDQ